MANKGTIANVKKWHANMYSELLPEMAQTMWDHDVYGMRDSNYENTEDGAADTLDSMELDYQIDAHRTDTYQCMKDYIDYMRTVDMEEDGEIDDDLRETIDKVCTAYASSASKVGGPISDATAVSTLEYSDQERLGYVMNRMDEISGGKFKQTMNDRLANVDTVKDMRHILSYADKIINEKYPDLQNLESVKIYKSTVDSYKKDISKQRMEQADSIVPENTANFGTDLGIENK